MHTLRIFAIASAAVLSASASAQLVGPRVDLPLAWVWRYDRFTNGYLQISRLRELALASNGTDFLAVWRQVGPMVGDVGPSGEEPITTPGGVFAVRISAAGELLDPAPIALSIEAVADGGDYAWPFTGKWVDYAAASDSYLVAWPCSSSAGTCAVHVSSAGAVVDAAPIVLPEGRIVVSDGQRHFVIGDTQMFSVAADGSWTAHPLTFPVGAVACDGTHFLNVAGSALTLFDAEGTVLATATTPVQLASAGVTFDGTDFVLVGTGPNAFFGHNYVLRVSQTGVPAGAATEIGRAGTDWAFDVSFDGLNEVAGWCVSCVVTDTAGAVLYAIHEGGAAPSPELVTTVGPMIKTLSIASTAAGISGLAVDGFRFWPSGPVPRSYRPQVQLVTTWAPVSVARSGSGAGRVVSDPAGVDCGSSCLGRFEVPGTVTLTATADAGSVFRGWSGDCETSEPICTLSLDSARTVVALFSDGQPPVLTVPDTIHAIATSASGAVVTFTATAEDNVGGSIEPLCAPASGARFAPGTTQVTCTVTDAEGSSASATFDVVVTFEASAVLPPVDPAGLSVFHLGRTVPLKFLLTGESAAIADLEATLFISKLQDGIAGVEEAAGSTAGATEGNTFRYDPIDGQYVFNLGTGGLSAGTWQARIDLGDGVMRSVLFSLVP